MIFVSPFQFSRTTVSYRCGRGKGVDRGGSKKWAPRRHTVLPAFTAGEELRVTAPRLLPRGFTFPRIPYFTAPTTENLGLGLLPRRGATRPAKQPHSRDEETPTNVSPGAKNPWATARATTQGSCQVQPGKRSAKARDSPRSQAKRNFQNRSARLATAAHQPAGVPRFIPVRRGERANR